MTGFPDGIPVIVNGVEVGRLSKLTAHYDENPSKNWMREMTKLEIETDQQPKQVTS